MNHGNCGCGCGGHSDDSQEPEESRSWRDVPNDEVICHCSEITKQRIIDAIRNGAYTVALIKIITGVGRGKPCPNDHRCLADTKELIQCYGTTTLSDALIPLDEEE